MSDELVTLSDEDLAEILRLLTEIADSLQRSAVAHERQADALEQQTEALERGNEALKGIEHSLDLIYIALNDYIALNGGNLG